MYTLKKQSSKSNARRGELKTSHGVIQSPFFMTIATRGAVKTLTTEDMRQLGAQIILSNTYHLNMRPGVDLLNEIGGLHPFMQWDGPILTDSGGYQVFSLAKMRKLSEKGVKFKDPVSGTSYELTPEGVIDIQRAIGSDMMMVLDECPALPCTKEKMQTSIALTHRWAQRAYDYKERLIAEGAFAADRHRLFGIVQGGTDKELRKESLDTLAAIPFDGYAIGGLAVGEPREEMYEMLDYLTPLMPADKPRYLMGVGKPEEIVHAVKQGVDMFDCVIPTRHARHGQLFVFTDRTNLNGDFYKTINITNEQYEKDFTVVDETYTDQFSFTYTKAYLRHLFKTNELLGYRLATLHNVRFYLELMALIRKAIEEDNL